MIIDKVKPKIERSQDFQELAFGIKDTAFVLEILRNKFYSNPIKIILQEIGANALDAHKEAGKEDTPIHIKLPTIAEPTFYIRDFGLGISQERMADIYVNYGSSTKSDSNEQHGGFGIGAKTPFSYTDAFVVETICQEGNDRIKRVYTCYIDETKIGKVAEMNRTKTDEPCGTKVSFGTMPKDVNSFAAHAQEVFSFWDVRPVIVDNTMTWQAKPKVLHSGTGWNMYEAGSGYNSYTMYRREACVNIKNILYKIDQQYIKHDFINKILSQYKLVLNFDIGELSIVGNRESLDYREKTIKALEARFDIVEKEIKAMLSKKMSSCSSVLEACIEFGKIKINFSSICPASLPWNGFDIGFNDIELHHSYGARFSRTSLCFYHFDKDITYKKEYGAPLNKETKYIFDDTGNVSVSTARIRTVFKNNPWCNTVVVLKPNVNVDIKVVRKDLKDLYKKYLIKELNFERLSKYDKTRAPADPTNGKGSYVLPRIYKATYDNFQDAKLWYDDDGFYLEKKGNDFYWGKDIIDRDRVKNIGSFLGKEVYGVPSKYISKLEAGWVSCIDALDDKLDKVKNDPKVLNDLDNIYDYESCGDLRSLNDFVVITIKKSMSLISHKNLEEYLKLSEKIRGIYTGNRFNSYIIKLLMAERSYGGTSRLKKLHKHLEEEFALVKGVYDRNLVPNIIEYINLKGQKCQSI